ncbi:MAG: hypothetical protein D4S01_08440 [Dehalococcoidia bacterium]|nr:MAG: hypothetical protein D4S01_08440 [Dehalococcoidia bacterium]
MKMIKSDFRKVSDWLSETEEPESISSDQITHIPKETIDPTDKEPVSDVPLEEYMKSEELYASIKNCSIDEAKTECSKLRKKIESLFPGSSPETIEENLYMKLKTSGTELQGDKGEFLIVALGPYKDMNFPRKRKALNLYEKDPEVAVNQKYVRIDRENNNTPVPIDNTEFYGNPPDPSRKNNNYKQDIPDDIRRDVVLLSMEGKILSGIGKLEAEPGGMGTVIGKITDDKVIVFKNGWKEHSKVSAQDLWTNTYGALANDVMAIAIEDVWEKAEPYKMIATKGKVVMLTITRQGSGGAMVALTEIGLSEDIVCFGDENDEYLKALVSDTLEKGMEVIVFGTANQYVARDGKVKRNINMVGLIPNPESSEFADVLAKMGDIEI